MKIRSILLSLVLTCGCVVGQTTPQSVYDIDGAALYDYVGRATANAGDVNGDGTDDVLIGIRGDDQAGQDAGSVRVLSGVDGSVIHAISGVANWRFGDSVIGLGDVDGDGFDDFAVGTAERVYVLFGTAPGTRILVYSGQTGSLIRTITTPSYTLTEQNTALACAGDVDGDGINDILATESASSPTPGTTWVFSGATGQVLHAFSMALNGIKAGTSAAPAGDVNGDGHADLLVGRSADFINGVTAGSAVVLSGIDGSVLFTLTGDGSAERFGWTVAGGRDLDGDSVPDLVIGAPYADGALGDEGKIYVHSGSTGLVIRTLSGVEAGELLGLALDVVGDQDGDGIADLLIGARFRDLNGPESGGCLVVSVVTGATIQTIPGLTAGDEFGSRVTALSDLDGDGVEDFVATGPFGAVIARRTGQATVFSAANGTPLFEFHDSGNSQGTFLGFALSRLEDIDGDGRDDFICGNGLDTTVEAGDGAVEFHSGLDGSSLGQTRNNLSQGFGYSVADAGDVNGDGVGDFVVGEPLRSGGAGAVYVQSGLGYSYQRFHTIYGTDFEFGKVVANVGLLDGDNKPEFVFSGRENSSSGTGAGYVRIYRSTSGGWLMGRYIGDDPGDQFGSAIDACWDVNGDGQNDYIVGARGDDDMGLECGSARIMNGLTNSGILTVYGDLAGDELGAAVAGLGDLNGDGHADFAVGAPLSDMNGVDSGYIRVHSGFDGSVLYRILGDNAGDQFGHTIVRLRDLDGDGALDFAVGAPHAQGTGLVRIYSGFDGSPIAQFVGSQAGSRFGHAITYLRDVDADGRDEIVIGAPFASTTGTNSGRVSSFQIDPAPVSPYRSMISNSALHLSWLPTSNDPAALTGALQVDGATPGALGLFGVSLAPIDYDFSGLALLIANDPVNLIDQGGFGYDFLGSFNVGGISRQQPFLAGSRVYLQFFETSPIPASSNGLSMLLAP